MRRLDVTVDSLVAELDEMLRLAVECGNPSAGVSAVMGKAKVVGLVVDKAEVEQRSASRRVRRQRNANDPLEEWQRRFAPKDALVSLLAAWGHLAAPLPHCYTLFCIQRGLRPRQPALTGNGGTTMWPQDGQQ